MKLKYSNRDHLSSLSSCQPINDLLLTTQLSTWIENGSEALASSWQGRVRATPFSLRVGNVIFLNFLKVSRSMLIGLNPSHRKQYMSIGLIWNQTIKMIFLSNKYEFNGSSWFTKITNLIYIIIIFFKKKCINSPYRPSSSRKIIGTKLMIFFVNQRTIIIIVFCYSYEMCSVEVQA